MSGTHHGESKTQPGCKVAVSDEPRPYEMTGAHVPVTVDPDDPNHLAGEKVVVDSPNGKTVITWDLTRGEGEGEGT